nr:hypothetical protein [Tautonia rosea]
MPGLQEREPADRLGVGAGEAELGRVVQDEDRTGRRLEAGPSGREVAGQDDPIVDPGVAEEAGGGLGGGPVPVGHRRGGADPLSEVAEQLAQPRPQTPVGELAAVEFVIHPVVYRDGPEQRESALTISAEP